MRSLALILSFILLVAPALALEKNTASQKWGVFCFDETSNVEKTGDAAQITGNVRIDGAAANAIDDTNPTELEDGFYIFDITAAESNGDYVIIAPASSTADIQCVGVPAGVYTDPPDLNSLTIASGAVDADLESIEGVGQSSVDLKDFADAGYNPATDKVTGVVLTDTTTAITNAVTADAFSESAVADLFSLDSGYTYGTSVAGSPVQEIADNAGGSSLTESGIADAVWDEVQSGHTTASTFGKYLDTEVSGVGGGSAAAIADAVWDEDIVAAHNTADTAGALLDVQADLKADVSALATTSALSTHDGKLDTVDGIVDSILADTGTDGVVIAAAQTVATATTVTNAVVTDAASRTASKADVSALALEATVATVDGIVDAILVDTGTTLPAEHAALPTAAENASDVWDEVITGGAHNDAGSAGRKLRTVSEYEGYGGAIWIDTVGGAAGTTEYENGTSVNPVDTLADAATLATSLNIKDFRIIPGSTITLDQTYTGYNFVGTHWTLALNGQDLGGSHFFGCSVSGIGSGAVHAHFEHSHIGAVTVPQIHIHDSSIIGPITLASAGDYFIVDSYSAIAGTATPSLDMGAAVANTGVNFRSYSGGIEVKNMNATGTDTMSLEGHGQIVLNASSVGGTVAIRGNFTVTDNTSGAVTLSDNARFAASDLVDEVWDEDIWSAHTTKHTTGDTLKNSAGNLISADTAQGAGTGSNQIQLAAGEPSTDGTFDPSMVFIHDGAGIGQSRMIIEYAGATRTATVDRDWKVAVDNTSEYHIIGHPGREHVNEGLAQAGAAGTIQLNALASSVDDTYNGQLVFIRSGTGQDQARRITDYDGGTVTATLDANWGTNPDATSGYVIIPHSAVSAPIQATVVAFSESGAADLFTVDSGYTFATSVAGSVVKEIGDEASAPTAAAVADAVWDEAQADHVVADTFGDYLDTEVSGAGGGSAADLADAVWDELLSGHVIDGSAGSALSSVGITGDILYTHTEYEAGHDGEEGYEVADVKVTVYSNDAATGDPIAVGYTDEVGIVELYLDDGIYYLFRRKAGRSFTNPLTIVVSE